MHIAQGGAGHASYKCTCNASGATCLRPRRPLAPVRSQHPPFAHCPRPGANMPSTDRAIAYFHKVGRSLTKLNKQCNCVLSRCSCWLGQQGVGLRAGACLHNASSSVQLVWLCWPRPGQALSVGCWLTSAYAPHPSTFAERRDLWQRQGSQCRRRCGQRPGDEPEPHR